MAGLFPGVCNSQNVDVNGRPLAAAVLSVYLGGTLTLASCFQDIALTVPAQNPMTADQTGRLPIFYVADGTYHVRLVDQTGVQIFDLTQIASIGASASGGGGGGGVDPTAIFQTGDPLWIQFAGTRTGWVRQNGRTLGSATSGASERANADCQSLFLYIWNTFSDTFCPVVGGRGVSALADWNANKQITLPDMRGRAPFGLDGMGNTRANRIPNGNIVLGGTGDTFSASGGEANHTLTTAETAPHSHVIPAHTHTVSGNTGNDTPGHIHDGGNATNQRGVVFVTGTASGNSGNIWYGNATVTLPPQSAHIHPFAATTDGGTQGSTDNGTGGGAAHNTMPPFMLGTWYMKL